MVQKVIIKDINKAALNYIRDLDAFKNGTVFEFKPGVNIIVGENGSGKTTLLELIRRYLMVDFTETGFGQFGSVMSRIYNGLENFSDGVEVYADYVKNTFRLSHHGEKRGEDLQTFSDVGTYYEQSHSSTGESVKIAMNSLFKYMFSDKARLKFDYEQEKIKSDYPEYYNYIQKCRIEDPDKEFTILMDEPDRNLSLQNIEDIKCIFEYHKPNTQIIGVLHNPLLIYWLSKHSEANFIEMTPGYINKIKNFVKTFTK